jgi:hypothetical protein
VVVNISGWGCKFVNLVACLTGSRRRGGDAMVPLCTVMLSQWRFVIENVLGGGPRRWVCGE